MTARPDRWVVPGDESGTLAEHGGKAVGLHRLLGLGLPVPRFVTLTVDAYHACCPGGRVPARPDARLEGALKEAYRSLASGGKALAVRSSAVEEDGVARSWAGQLESHLNVRTPEALGQAVLACWRSLHGERADAYRDLRGGDAGAPGGDAMAVVIQEMLCPEASGVLFTLDPVTGNRDRMIVSAVFGLGEGLVSGALDADTYVVDRIGQVVQATVATKSERVVSAAGGGVRREVVAPERTDAPVLDARLLRELARRAARAEEAAGLPLDMEFAVQEGHPWFLQARPITAVPPHPGSHGGERRVWDNSNIVESYPGITLPLTFSFIRRAYHAVYWQFCRLLGLTEGEIRSNDHMLWNMLGLHRGRVYYNLGNWYRLVSILPAFRHNRRFMERMMGVTRAGGDDAQDRVSRSRGLIAAAMTAARAIYLQASLDRSVRRFHETFDRVHASFAALPYESMDAGDVLKEFRRVEQALLWRWKAPIVNDFSVMVFYGLLERLTVAWGVDPEGHFQNALLARQGGIESTEVSDRLEELADAVRADRSLRDAVLRSDPREVFGLVEGHAVCGPLLRAYMSRFGDRCVAELKLESRTMHDDPTPVMTALKASVRRGGDRGPRPRPSTGREAYAAVRHRLSPWKRPLYAWVLGRARRGIRNRENQRLARTRAFALVRRMMRQVGRRLAAAGVLDHWEDVFYLELDELMGLCDGTATLADLRPVVTARRREYRAFRDGSPPPDRFVTHGPVATAERVPEPAEPTEGADVLRGLAAYPGRVEGPAVVMLEPDAGAAIEGRILVTRQTDPGWVILFPGIAGLVVERGSLLSHSAIVAREMGIPTVVGVRGATEAIRSGDPVRLDGAAGTVEVGLPARAGDLS